MILTTHAVVGAALASFLPSHPATAFAVGFASHFVLDAIPHVDYPIKSRSVDPKIGAPMAFDRALLQDGVGSDGLFGIIVSLVLFSSSANFWVVLMGAIGAMLPDPLQFASTRLRYEPLRTLQRFHLWAHSKKKMDISKQERASRSSNRNSRNSGGLRAETSRSRNGGWISPTPDRFAHRYARAPF
jgi:hypothetical protein